MKKLTILSACCLFLAIGCGGDDGGGSYGDPIPNASAETAGTQSVDGATQLTTIGADPMDGNAVGQAFGVYGNLAQMAGAKQSTAPSAWGGDDSYADFPGCVSESSGTITYTDCDSGGTTIDGTITATASNVDIDLMLSNGQVDIDMDGDLDFSATSLSGYIKYTTSIDAGGMTINTVYDGQYDITLDGAGCAVGGQVEVHYTVSGSTGIDVWAKAEFGPGCGDVTFY